MAAEKVIRTKRSSAGKRPVIGLRSTAEITQRQLPAPAAEVQERCERTIAEAAYYRAEKRGFAAGHELEDWLAAEAEFASTTSGASADLH